MAEFTPDTLRLHAMWLRDEEGGERADLRRANLRWANLSWADLSGTGVATMTIGQYTLWCTPDMLRIGCQSHRHDEWRAFGDAQILAMDGRDALDWWRANRGIVFAIMDACAAVGARISAGSDE